MVLQRPVEVIFSLSFQLARLGQVFGLKPAEVGGACPILFCCQRGSEVGFSLLIYTPGKVGRSSGPLLLVSRIAKLLFEGGNDVIAASDRVSETADDVDAKPAIPGCRHVGAF
jgi:hypothetical protein